MIDQSVQTPNFRDNYTLILTPDELSLLKTALIEHLAHGGRDQDILDALYSKLQLTLSSDGACIRPAQPLEAVVEQGGLIVTLETYHSIAHAASSFFTLLDTSILSIPPGLFKDRCRDAYRASSWLFQDHLYLDQFQSFEAVEQGGSIRDSVRHGGTVVPDHICGQCYTDKSDSHSCNRDDCLEKSISSDGACLHSAQSSDPVPLQRSPIGFSHQSYSCGLCGMYHRKEQSCMLDMKPRDSEKGLLGFHEFYGPSYHAEDFDIDGFVFDYLTSPDVGNGVRS